jgi:peptidoglycan hydrolase CwlO-like protein
MRKTIIASVGLLVLALAAGANAQDIDTEISGAQHDAASARSRLDAIHMEIGQLQAEISAVEAAEERLIRAILNTQRRQEVLWAQLQNAREVLAHRAAAAYQVGPAAALEVLLSVSSPSELASAQAFTERAFGSDTDLIAKVEHGRAEAERNAAILRDQRAALDVERTRLRSLLDEVGIRLAEAEQIAEAADLKVRQLQEKKQALIEAAPARPRARPRSTLRPTTGPGAPTGTRSRCASRAATGPRTRATGTGAGCSSIPAPGTPTAAGRSTARGRSRTAAGRRSPSPRRSWPARARARGRTATAPIDPALSPAGVP